MGENSMARAIGRTMYGLLLFLIGLALALGGAKLIWLGGSWYYLPAGLFALLSGYNVLKRNWWTGAAIYGVLLLITLIWALCEAGLDGWALMPRVVSPLVLGLPFLIVALTSRIKADRQGGWLVVGTAAVLALAVWANSGFAPVPAAAYPAPAAAGADDGDWLHFGNDQGGRHFSALSAIDRSNVGKLQVAWTAPLGPMPLKPVPAKSKMYLSTASRHQGAERVERHGSIHANAPHVVRQLAAAMSEKSAAGGPCLAPDSSKQ